MLPYLTVTHISNIIVPDSHRAIGTERLVMSYNVGQKVNLWRIEVDGPNRVTRVLKSVVVTITETKTGVLGEFSRKPVSLQSLRGIGDDGTSYEKHWDSWPEGQMNDFSDQWSTVDDSEDFWIPKEATSAYHNFVRYGKRELKVVDRIVGPDGNDIIPQGDVTHCEKHDEYDNVGDPIGCIECFKEARRGKSA